MLPKNLPTDLEAFKTLNSKSIEEYTHTHPLQLAFFQLSAKNHQQCSHTMQLYDFLPKYHWGRIKNRFNGQYLPRLKRAFGYQGQQYILRIDPAKIELASGQTIDFYPGEREELVEQVLRKFASDETQGVFLDNQVGVEFTIYQLQKELKRLGRSYSYTQIKEALNICVGCTITLSTTDGSIITTSHIFERVVLNSTSTLSNSKCYVVFNSMVTANLNSLTFRLVNYEKNMAINSVVARQLHRRLSHHFTQASPQNIYNLKLTTIIKDCGLTFYEKLSNNLRHINVGLEELQEKKIISNYKIEKIFDTTQHLKLMDATIHLIPHPTFIEDIILANKKQKEIKASPLASQLVEMLKESQPHF